MNDELIAMDGFRLADDLSKFLGMRKPGEMVTFTVSRGGILKEISLVLEGIPHVKYAIEKVPESDGPPLALFSKWAMKSAAAIKD